MITELQTQAATFAETLAPDSAAAFLRYHRHVIETFVHLETKLSDQTDNLRSLRSDITAIIHEAITTYVAGLEAERSALSQEIAELQRLAQQTVAEQRVIRTMLVVMAERMGALIVIGDEDQGPPDEPMGGRR